MVSMRAKNGVAAPHEPYSQVVGNERTCRNPFMGARHLDAEWRSHRWLATLCGGETVQFRVSVFGMVSDFGLRASVFSTRAGETELRHRMKWLLGMMLYSDRSQLEMTCKAFNRTPFVWPRLFWINTTVPRTGLT